MTDVSLSERGQITEQAAEIYDSRFVPSLFGQFGPWLVKFAGLNPGARVLDLATGTGVAALAAHQMGAVVTAVDLNAGMLRVAERKSDQIEWIAADVQDLPFEAASFDVVLCQFGFMFFPDRAKALSEAFRVLRPGGVLAIAVFDALDRSPAYRDLVPMLGRIVGSDAADALCAPFVLGDARALASEIEAAGGRNPRIKSVTGTSRHSSINSWLDTEVGGWTISDMVSDDQLAALKAEASVAFRSFETAGGRVAFPAPAHFLSARK